MSDRLCPHCGAPNFCHTAYDRWLCETRAGVLEDDES